LADIHVNRLKNIRNKMASADIGAVLVTKRVNYMYLSGFTGTSAILFISRERAVLLTDFRYVEQAACQAPDYEIIRYEADQFEEINRLLENEAIKRLAFEDSHLSYSQYTKYSEKLKVNEFIPLGGMIEELRCIKDPAEIDLIKQAVGIADEVFLKALDIIRPGITEMELADEMEYQMKRLGAEGPSFETIAASGRRASMPHGVASEKKIEYGDVITLDFGAIYKGYCSDITRTVFLGKPHEELEKIFRIVLDANQKGLAAVTSGIPAKEADLIVRDFIRQKGYGDNFGHGLGHGVGLEIHEDPSLSFKSDMVLRDNMVVTVEPGIYIPDLGGVRIEDMVVVSGDAALVLTKSPKDMIIL
jgi:Xaa-Pro aminopeptidase